MSVSNYIIKSEQLHNKIKNFYIALPYGVLAHKFLKQCQCFSAVQTTQSACNFNWTKTRKYKKKNSKSF